MRQLPVYLPDYLMGFTLSGLVLSNRVRRWVAPLSVVFFIYCGYTLGGNDQVVLGSTMYGLAYASIIIGFEHSRIFANQIAELLGKWSYGIYLFHLPLLVIFGLWGVPLTILISAGMYYGFEKQFMTVGNLLIARLMTTKNTIFD